MRPTETNRSDPDDDEPFGPYEIGPQQKTFDFNPTQFTPAERARFLREIAKWTREEEEEDFKQLPGETRREFFAARDAHMSSFDTFGPNFTRVPKISEAWLIMHGQHPQNGRAPPANPSIQLTLTFDPTASDEAANPEELPHSTEEIL